MIHIIDRGTADPARFGFIVGKNVGNAVTRNAIRRRLRAISRDLIPELGAGRDVVIRALPGSSATPWSILHSEIAEGIERSVSRR
jgi:ribonuclease P protein component